MSEVHPEGETSPIVRRLAVYAQAGLLMVVGVYFVWAFVGGLDAQLAMSGNAELITRVNDITKSGLSGDKMVIQVLQVMAPHMHWFEIALVASLVSFPVLGYFLGRYVDDPNWAGILPVLDLLSGMNPAYIGDNRMVVPLEMGQQLAVLLTQIIAIQAVAVWANRRQVRIRESIVK